MVIIVWLAAFFGFAALRGFVLSVMWGWFMVPTFGLPPLGIASAFGVALMVGVLTQDPSAAKEKEKLSPGKTILKVLMINLVPLAIG